MITAPAIGRNDPCLCGSEYKYKKCCIHKSEKELRDLFEDVEHPRVNDWFFYYHPFTDLSAAMLMHADLTMPMLQELATSVTRQIISRGEEEAEQIRKEQNPLRLLEYLNEKIDNLNFTLLINRLLEFESQVTPVLLDMLREAENDMSIEQGARYLYKVDEFPMDQVLVLAEQARNPYARSTFCLLLGLKGDVSVLPIIWRQYIGLRNQYPLESYSQGPLFGLYEYAIRFGLISR